MPPPDHARARQLLAEGAALRSLARALLGGHADAEDLVQDTLLASLQSPCPDAGRRPWLVGTLRNLALLWRRTSTRRAAREVAAAAAPKPGEGDPAAIAAQAEAMREVAAAVHELEEPFRTVVVLRFWRGLLPEAIAQQLGVPRNTVRSRLQRGLERLRARLDRNFGERRGWQAALVPLASQTPLASYVGLATPGAGAVGTTFGAILMANLQVGLVTAALVAVGVLVWWLDHPSAEPPTPRPGQRTEAAAAHAAVASHGDAATTTAVVAADTPPADRQAAEPAPSLTVLGSVTRAKTPCPDVALTLQWFDGMDTNATPTSLHNVRSDASGQFVWRGPVRSNTGTLRAVRAGTADDTMILCTPQHVHAGQTVAKLPVTLLALEHTVFGRVHDVHGAPIAGAELTVNGWRDIATSSDADGRYELKVPGPPYLLLVHKTSYRERMLDATVVEGMPRNELDIELQPGAAFSGRVVDAAGKPIAGAKVRASGLALGTETDAAGQFVFGGAAPDESHGLTVTKAGFQPTTKGATAGEAPVEIVLHPGLELTLRAVGERGEALSGVRVGVRSEAFRPMENHGYTDAQGLLRLCDLPAKRIDLVADKAGFVAARSEVDVPALRGEVVLMLRAGRAIAGRVLDQRGLPIVGASIHCEVTPADSEPRTVGSRIRSDGEGRFELRDLPPEPCHVLAHHDDYRRASLPVVGGSPADLLVRMEPAASVTGRVVDGISGAPVAAFTIELSADHEVHPLQYVHPVRFAAPDGSFAIKHWQLQPDTALFVDVAASGYAPQRIVGAARVDAPRDMHVIQLFPGTTVCGIVRDAVSGMPVQDAEVVLLPGDPEDISHRSYVTATDGGPNKTASFTNAEGRFELRCVPPGQNRLQLAHRDYPKRTFGPFEVQAGVPVLEVEPTLKPGSTLRGRVTGMPQAAGMKLAVRGIGDKTLDCLLGADCSFEVLGVPAGKVSLSFSPAKGTRYTLQVEVGDAPRADVVFAIPQPGTGSVRATVTGMPRGRGVVASLGAAPGQCSTVRTFEYADAGFVVGDLPPGRYEVEVYPNFGAGSGRAEVDVGTGEVAVTIDVVRR
ncbi:MAG: sigma-70 family RNA polymerase sigma factor [Planctomycetes bacterium]|nr:sigma-70 family RNA polymerase sigma factor [Planctomycetota bacterium]